jgi:hypothetical protein
MQSECKPIFVKDDGGRAAAGFTGHADDCVTRAIAIATGKSYAEVYDDLCDKLRSFKPRSRTRYAKAVARKIARGSGHNGTTPRRSVNKLIYRPYLEALGWRYVTALCNTTWLELPHDRPLIVITNPSRHLVAVVHGRIFDTWDCATKYKTVLGYFEPIGD